MHAVLFLPFEVSLIIGKIRMTASRDACGLLCAECLDLKALTETFRRFRLIIKAKNS